MSIRIAQGHTKSMAVTSTSSSIALPSSIVGNVLLTNLGTNKCYVRFGGVSPVTAVGSDLCVPANVPVIVNRDLISDLYIGAVCDSAETATLKVAIVSGE